MDLQEGGLTLPLVQYNSPFLYNAALPYNGLTTLAARLRNNPSLALVFLAEVTVGQWCRAWTLTASQTYTYQVAAENEVTAVVMNGATTLTERASVAAVESNAGSWYHDGSTLYVRAPGGSTVFDSTYIATLCFRFSSRPKIFSENYYEPRLKTIPNVSLRIEEMFGGVGQVSGGNLAFINADGFFDSLDDLLWDYGTVTVKVGADTRTDAMTYTDYEAVGTWLVEDWSLTQSDFTLKLRESKSRLKKKVPLEFVTREDYPTAHESDIGKPIPRAYGTIYGAAPLLVDASTKTFKVAGHAVRSIDAVRLNIDDVWTNTTPTAIDLADGEFTLGSDWVSGVSVSVDFTGMKNADGSLMTNAADVIEDLLDYVGETAINSTALATARERLSLGTNINDGSERNVRAPGLYVADETDVLEIIGTICELIGGFMFSDSSGQLHFNTFWPTPGEALQSFTDADWIDFQPMTETKDAVSKLVTKFSERTQDAWAEIDTREVVATQYIHNEPVAVVKTGTIAATNTEDAAYWNERAAQMLQVGSKTYRLTIPFQALLTLPGDQVRVEDSRSGFNEVLEVLQVNASLLDGKVQLVCGNLRAWAKTAGYWVNDADELPTRFSSLAGYGTGELTWNASWDSQIKAWARQNVGYWTDANGFADSDDPDSFIVSTWF